MMGLRRHIDRGVPAPIPPNPGITPLYSSCLLVPAHRLEQGGAIISSSEKSSFNNSIGEIVVLINSTLEECSANEAAGGIYVNRNALLHIKGNLNRY